MIWEPSRSCEPDRAHNSCPLPNYQLRARTYKSAAETPIDVFSGVRNIFIGEKCDLAGDKEVAPLRTIGYKSRGHSNCDASSSHDRTARPGFGQPRVNHAECDMPSRRCARGGGRGSQGGHQSYGVGVGRPGGVCSSGLRVKWRETDVEIGCLQD